MPAHRLYQQHSKGAAGRSRRGERLWPIVCELDTAPISVCHLRLMRVILACTALPCIWFAIARLAILEAMYLAQVYSRATIIKI